MDREPTKVERAAMWRYGVEYAHSGLSAIDFWKQLDVRRKKLMRDMVRQIETAAVFEL